MKKSGSLPSILSKFEDSQNVKSRRQALLDKKSKKKYFAKNNLRKINKCDNSSQTEFEWDWMAVLINTFLGIVLPTFDIYSDFLFLIGTWQLLHAPAPSTLFTSEEEAGRIF